MSVEINHVFDNYKSINADKGALGNNWCISPYPGKIQQVKLVLNNKKSFDYACRYAVSADSVAIVGYSLPVQYGDSTYKSPNTGMFGQVKEALPKLTIKRSHAVEADYVFIPTPGKADIKRCVKYLQCGPDDYEKTLQFDKGINVIRPITYFIKRTLAAASILAHKELVDQESAELAKAAILEDKHIDEKVKDLHYGPPEEIGVDFSDIQVCDPDMTELDSFISTFSENEQRYFRDYELDSMSDILSDVISSETVKKHVNKYSHFGAVSIMVRGGFKKMLEAYLSVDPPIADFYDEMCSKLDGVGYKEVFDVLKAYKSL